ncbi:Major facilitator superfamily domain, general substrate transporter [Metarhizium album ARSEF 1941]|uniref:Major facilitator superfamily domain, general substrate transporter n=1 Tax=Metarhizium album (strain ARSEF 1941) TaxID=1081103 RepID=A0A0B2X2X9_METAS|nr:Major facilitator superfamily domain, general substrate transporter [Metarhizium album ARSEF 1941]KHN99655.1 Major facilitator superfamily domain, general substrate transporter [Metarhizium album ARSEF 1941]
MAMIARYLPFAPSTTTVQAVTYLLGISLFSIAFLVFLNSSLSFVVTDLIGQKKNVGDVVGTLGFADEIVALVACPTWGLISDRLGVRWVAVMGYAIIGLALVLFVQAKNVYPQLLLARILFAVGASAAATMVTAILPSLTDEEDVSDGRTPSRYKPNQRLSLAISVESEATITPERYTRSLSNDSRTSCQQQDAVGRFAKPSALAGLVGLFTGCGALVALSLFLPLPARFGDVDGVTPGQAVSYSFYVVGAVSLVAAAFVFMGLRNLKGEEGKGWMNLFGISQRDAYARLGENDVDRRQQEKVVPYLHLMKDSVLLGFADSRIALGYIGGFVARASTVAISLFIPLYVNTFFISNGFCQGSPNDPSPELKEECRAAYVLSSILTGVAQLMGLVCAPVFGYVSGRGGRVNYPIVVATALGMIGYLILPQLSSPEYKNVDERGGTPWILVVVTLVGVSQIGAIVCSLGSLGQGVIAVELPWSVRGEPTIAPDQDESAESEPLMGMSTTNEDSASRVRLKGSIAGVYSLCGGAAILLLTKLGGALFDSVSKGAPFYMMAVFNGVLLVASLLMDASQAFARARERIH